MWWYNSECIVSDLMEMILIRSASQWGSVARERSLTWWVGAGIKEGKASSTDGG